MFFLEICRHRRRLHEPVPTRFSSGYRSELEEPGKMPPRQTKLTSSFGDGDVFLIGQSAPHEVRLLTKV